MTQDRNNGTGNGAGTGTDGAGGTCRGLRIALMLSLGLNLLIAGAVAGGLVWGDGWRHRQGMRPEGPIAPLIHALSEPDRRAIGHEIRKAWGEKGARSARHRAELEALAAELTKEPYDAAAVEARLARLHEMVVKRMEFGLEMLSRRLAEMEPRERAAYAERLREELARRGRHRE